MESRPLRMLSGVEIVDRGRNVTDCILPEIGLKEVTPNGSWLETKQVQTALEARMALVAAERIDKVGALSHAEWNDQLKLAEVTQQVGGYWQYIGHKVNGTFFLLPEEALYLIETNCLLLKHNQVTVSLQKAYSLLLDEHMTLTQYKVYASLSRVGYKVFRHGAFKPVESKVKAGDAESQEKHTIESEKTSLDITLANSENTNDKCQKQNGMFCDKVSLSSDQVTNLVTDVMNKDQIGSDIINDSLSKESENSQVSRSDDHSSQIPLNDENECVPQNENEQIKGNKIIPKVIPSIDKHGVIRLEANEMSQTDVEMSTVSSSTPLESQTTTDAVENKNPEPNKSKNLNIYQILQQKIKSRQIRPADPKNSQEVFNRMPDCYNKDVITVKVPSEEYLPRNIFLNNTSYVLNLPELRRSKRRRKSTSATASTSVENRAMYRTIRNSSESETAAVPTPEIPQLLPNTPLFQQSFGYFPSWRPRYQNFNQFPRHQFNQHPFFYRMMHYMPHTFNTNRPRFFTNQRKRQYDLRDDHFRAIHNFANRLKQFYRPTDNSIRSLHGLVARFNEIYNGKIRITTNFDVMDDEDVETIELDDDDVETKKPKLDNAMYEKYLDSVKALAAKLKNLERKNQLNSKQKRAFCNLLDNFNETFDTEFHLDSKGVLIDKKLVVLDSSSDSDVVPTDDVPAKKKRSHSDNNGSHCKRRKVINPLSILRKVNVGASTSKSLKTLPDTPIENNTDLLKYFDKRWLPDDDDFGKATPCAKINSSHLWSDSTEFYEFISWTDQKSWVDLKLTYCSHMEAVSNFEDDLSTHSRNLNRNGSMDNSRLKPILAQEPGADWATSLEKLRIIKTNTDVQETSLTIDFDVFNRDVQNFRKTDPPKPHFRVICVEAYSKFPSGAEVRSLHSRHEDNVTTVFAVVDVGSITYLQINPKDLPVYVGND